LNKKLRGETNPFTAGCLAFVTVILAVVVVFGVAWASFGIDVATAGIVGRGKAHIQLQSAPYRIQAYDHFHDSCASIQGLEYQLDAQFLQLKQTTDQVDRSKIQTQITGIQGLRSQAIAQYNQDAQKSYTLGQFRDSNLPFSIPNNIYTEGGTKTSCTN